MTISHLYQVKQLRNNGPFISSTCCFIFKRVLEGNETPALPATRVRPTSGELHWFLDKGAAANLKNKL